jgi:hypothetical protein
MSDWLDWDPEFRRAIEERPSTPKGGPMTPNPNQASSMSVEERVEVLSLGYTEPPVECTKQRWWEIFRGFTRRAADHAANLAAHNWDVLLVDDRVFLFQTRYGGSLGHWLNHDATREDATEAEQAQLYDAKERRFLRARSGAMQSKDER